MPRGRNLRIDRHYEARLAGKFGEKWIVAKELSNGDPSFSQVDIDDCLEMQQNLRHSRLPTGVESAYDW